MMRILPGVKRPGKLHYVGTSGVLEQELDSENFV